MQMGGGLIDIKQFKIAGLGEAELSLVGKIQQSQELMPFEGKPNVQQFNLCAIGRFPRSQLAGAFDVRGEMKPDFKLDMKGRIGIESLGGCQCPRSARFYVSSTRSH